MNRELARKLVECSAWDWHDMLGGLVVESDHWPEFRIESVTIYREEVFAMSE